MRSRFALSSRDIELRVHPSGEIPVADDQNLRSTPLETLAALWRESTRDRAEPIIIRPPYGDDKFPARKINGNWVPVNSASNVGIVEVLGPVGMGQWDWSPTTFVGEFLDGDLTMLFGTRMN